MPSTSSLAEPNAHVQGSRLFDLALVMPVYNEAECIGEVVEAWLTALERLQIQFQLIILNDGSTDNTWDMLQRFAGRPSIQIINKPNSGHGPTILAGYKLAVERAEWVFQCDSDNEMQPDGFAQLWQRRGEFDALVGTRFGRTQHWSRWLITSVACWTVRSVCGAGIEDVNCPYRLIRANLLADIVNQLPPDLFSPNVIISGGLNRSHAHIANFPVAHQCRQTGTVSIVGFHLWQAAVRSFLQTLWYRPRCRSLVGRSRKRTNVNQPANVAGTGSMPQVNA